MLIEKLLESQSVEQWEKELGAVFTGVAGDDVSMCAAAFDYGDFVQMREAFIGRVNELYASYISKLEEHTREEKTVLWQAYNSRYYRLQ